MIHTAREIGFDPMVLHAVEARNIRQKQFLLDKIVARFGGDLRGLCFALWGLSFKPNTDDMREAPSRTILEGLWARGARVQAYDPNAMAECRRLYGERADLLLCESASRALQAADALIVATEWKGFSAPDFDAIRDSLEHPVIFDGRNIYDPAVATRHGLQLIGVGRKNAEPPGEAEWAAPRDRMVALAG
jgi:UDPglucose 6-dehydrogenase